MKQSYLEPFELHFMKMLYFVETTILEEPLYNSTMILIKYMYAKQGMKLFFDCLVHCKLNKKSKRSSIDRHSKRCKQVKLAMGYHPAEFQRSRLKN